MLLATNEYHVSSVAPDELQEGAPLEDGVAPSVLPATGEAQMLVEDGVSEMAPLHSSLAGGGGGVPTQISNFVNATPVL